MKIQTIYSQHNSLQLIFEIIFIGPILFSFHLIKREIN